MERRRNESRGKRRGGQTTGTGFQKKREKKLERVNYYDKCIQIAINQNTQNVMKRQGEGPRGPAGEERVLRSQGGEKKLKDLVLGTHGHCKT